MRPAELIERKRNGEELAADEIAELILGYARGEIPDYQLAAFCMAVYFRGLNAAETYALTDAMIRSGRTLDLGAALGRKVVDKHSTGGVGDKTTIAVGPIVAACGVPDKQLYGLRDVTATVDILPLIASSIMSKKIAGGADAIVLDVKVGDGAFMKTIEDARVLAEAMLELGRYANREVVCLLTDMDQPLGAAVGNALEIVEARATVCGEGPPDFTELVLDACARLLALSDLGIDVAEGRRRAESAVADGAALAVYERWIRAQGGDPDPGVLPRAPVIRELLAPVAGHVARLGAIDVGHAALHLGAGRAAKADEIDHSVGIVCRAKRGDVVAEGDVLAEIHARTENEAKLGAGEVLAAYVIGDVPAPERSILLDVIA
ncbi:MAG: thymidine phosphorylase [Actinobacteria bacterium]|nr:thymidine phosphorylase [Actinomycetota bacterium]